jgi:hypothetical protein
MPQVDQGGRRIARSRALPSIGTPQVEPVVVATEQQATADEAARLPLTRVAAALERGDDGEVGHEQRQCNEDRETALVGEPKQHSHDDQHDSDGRTLSDLGRLAIERR